MKYTLRILRGDAKKQYFEEFEIEHEKNANIISALMQIQKNPVNKNGIRVAPVSFEMSCLEEVCGACSMLINGYPRQACSTLVDALLTKNSVIVLAPLSKFHVIRDLIIDRTKMFDQLKKMKIWVEAEEIDPKEFGLKIDQALRDSLYILSKCMMCGCCMESCPQYNDHSLFMGPFAVMQLDFFNRHPLGKKIKDKRFPFIIEKGGISECGNAQNCKRVCPKDIPITQSVAILGREASKFFLKKIFLMKAEK